MYFSTCTSSYKVVFICNSHWLLSDYPEVMHSCNRRVVIFYKNQVKTLSSFLGQSLVGAEDEVVTEEKEESPCFEISKIGLAYSEGKSCARKRLRGEHDPSPSLTCTVTDLSHCSFRKGPEFLLLQCIVLWKTYKTAITKKEKKYIENRLIYRR